MTLPRPSSFLSGTALVVVLATACGPTSPPMTCAPWAAPADLAARPSPFDSVTLHEDTVLRAKLCYSRPFARGRMVFGGLVPFDTLWRTGANEPTILHLGQPALVAGMPVAAGNYSIYTVPGSQGWTVVVNASTSQWGLTVDDRGPQGNPFPNAYTEQVRAQEVGRSPILTEEIDFQEQLTASFDPVTESEYRLLFDWETTRIVVPLRFVDEGP